MLGTKIRMVVQRDTWNYQITKTVLVEKMAQTSSIWLLVVKKIMDTLMENFLSQEETSWSQMARTGDGVNRTCAKAKAATAL